MGTQFVASALSDELATVAQRVRESMVQVQAGPRSMGSGVIWGTGEPDATGAAEARIITNAHVVAAARSQTLTVRVADGRELTASVAAMDPEHDLALLQTRAAGLRGAEYGDSTALRVGEMVLAVGNPWGHEGAVTVGVVEARAPADPNLELEPAEEDDAQREQQQPDRDPRRAWAQWRPRRIELIQADIRLYPGNSGGPLADARGRVVGINAMIGGGLGFAIPSRTVQQFLEEADGSAQPVVLGVQVLTVPLPIALRERLNISQETAALIAAVEAGGAGEQAGLLVGDVLLAVDGISVRAAEYLGRILNRVGAHGQPHALTIARAGERQTLTLTPTTAAAA
ncbi:MAG TPA: trypsin-like peptidase domain-containing protein [Ktedonobacterales bacterium]|nr:trypsin-like peptidase domain-containing protein [Ktedonobacterales bacterium]